MNKLQKKSNKNVNMLKDETTNLQAVTQHSRLKNSETGDNSKAKLKY